MEVPLGLQIQRLLPVASCPREVALAEAWKAAHEYSDLMSALFSVPCNKGDDGAFEAWPFGGYRKKPLGEPTERDRIVAATVFQWIGSNVGLGTVINALEKSGYAVTFNYRSPTQQSNRVPVQDSATT